MSSPYSPSSSASPSSPPTSSDSLDFSGPTGAQWGDRNTQHNYYGGAPRPAAALPHQVGVIPPRAGAFQDRAERARLREVVAGEETAVLGQVLRGLGGVGKTQLAADYARTVWAAGEVDLLVWVTAVDRPAVVAGLGRAGAEVTGADPGDPEAAAEAFVAWLEPKAGRGPCRWLVVLDDVADPADLRGLWPPASSHGRTVITTRRRDAALTGPGRRRIDVGVFSPAEAAAYVAAVLATYDRTEPAAEVRGLAADLGHLPLALSQAAAYVVDAGIPLTTYRTRLADRTRTLTEVSPDALPDAQTRPMAAAWALSVEYADRLRPAGLARPMLQLAAFLDPNGIPLDVLTSEPALAYLTEHRTEGAADAPGGTEAAVGPDDALGALRALHRLSLVQAPDLTDLPSQGASIHRIVQRATRDALVSELYEEIAHTSADALMAVWPRVERDTALAQALRACAISLAAYTENNACLYRPDAHLVLFRVGRSLGESGQVTTAIGYSRHMADMARLHLGPDHPDTLNTLNNLAYWQGEAGEPAEAVQALAGLVTDYLRVLGADHPRTLTTRSNFAHWQGEAGNPAEAAEALANLLTDRLRVLGPDHPDTLTTRNNLAYWRGEAGDPAGAAEALANLLTDRRRLLGPDHPSTLVTRGNLATWRGEAGDPAKAASDTADLLKDFCRILGPDHPRTLTTRNNLAIWQGRAGDPAAAADAFAGLLTDQTRVLGPDHPNTLTTRNNLAIWQGEAGNSSGAAADLAALLTDQMRVLGPDHPNILSTRNNLAYWRKRSAEAPSPPT
ncbi:tetratricopeptide repeat protein [Streptomyces sp. NBC_01190]|uniref:tetratricopeptide repeat protein n=1 Tax=Streptomyces sp. NBC_01190 TaxID=2903767 RepID=UPI0038666E11|nr:tetratricopeptide repeat protein [Streptomyces sp. NBC_01190]